jgi:hypothetical protein
MIFACAGVLRCKSSISRPRPSCSPRAIARWRARSSTDSAADAIRFAIEELPEPQLLGACIEINERRLGHQEIRALYSSPDYPLKKKQAA